MTEQGAQLAYDTEYRRLWDSTVDTLTAAVQLVHPERGAMDFPDFLASALGTVAANVGSASRITAGRPGSWESDALGRLVAGTVGYDADALELAPRRTVPVLVPLNVAQLVAEAYEDAPAERREAMLPHVDDAVQVIYQAGKEWSAEHPAPADDATATERDAYAAAADDQAEQEQAAEDELRARYAATFEAYAAAFTAAVLDEASTIEGLTVAVDVQARTDPEEPWWGPTDTTNPDAESDPLAWRLWSAARDRLPVPSSLIEIPLAKPEE